MAFATFSLRGILAWVKASRLCSDHGLWGDLWMDGQKVKRGKTQETASQILCIVR